LPAYAWFFILLLLPLVYIVVVSFCTVESSWGYSFTFTLDNYKRLFDASYAYIFGQSFLIAAISTVGILVIAYPFAYFLTKINQRWRLLALLAVVMPFIVSSVIRIYGWDILLQSKGIINTLLISLGIIDEPIQLLYTNGAVVLGTIYTLLPIMVLPLYNSLERIDPFLVQAARDLGASPAQAFLRVTLRESVPGIVSGCLLVFVPSIGLFYVSDMLGGSNTMLLGNLIKNQFIEMHNWPFGAALAVVMAVVTLLCIALAKRASGTDSIEVM
jgi:spermidine/putrescine transport system permease protein